MAAIAAATRRPGANDFGFVVVAQLLSALRQPQSAGLGAAGRSCCCSSPRSSFTIAAAVGLQQAREGCRISR